MKEFEVTITETLEKTVIVEANSKDDALQIKTEILSLTRSASQELSISPTTAKKLKKRTNWKSCL